jgi:tRNA U34 2-thiouridine synthase MnmA/TrmU
MAKAILLLSGGLDSTLAGALLIELGIEVEGINFVSPFCQCTPKSLGCPASKRAAEQLGIPVRVFACGPEYLETIKRPRFGRGRGVNACIDCRIHMFKQARQYMIEQGADFVATGEVLGERPMSQHRQAMDTIERESGLEDLIVRPLSAQLMRESLPERTGLVDRRKLKAIQGRRRLPQFELARELGIDDYLCPAGGCLLTDRDFAARFRDLFEREPGFGIDDARLLRYGRHFRLSAGTKVIVGRNEEESTHIERATRPEDVLLVPHGTTGPSVLCRGVEDPGDITVAAGIMAAYTKGGIRIDVEVKDHQIGDEPEIIRDVQPINKAVVAGWRVGATPSRPASEVMQT